MSVVEKKIWQENFEAIVAGTKKCELRLGDQAYAVGDTLVLREWEPKTKTYTGRELKKTIIHVGNPFQPADLPWTSEEIKDHGLVLLSLE